MIYLLRKIFVKKTENSFDKRFGFILKYKIDNEKNYNGVKKYYNETN